MGLFYVFKTKCDKEGHDWEDWRDDETPSGKEIEIHYCKECEELESRDKDTDNNPLHNFPDDVMIR